MAQIRRGSPALVFRLSSKRTARLFFTENLVFCQTPYFDLFDFKIISVN